MKTNLLLLDSYKNIEDLISFAFSFSNRFNRRLKIDYVFDFDWMRQSAMAGAPEIVGTNIINAEKAVNEEYEVAETKIREIVTNCLKKQALNFPVDINVTRNNRIDVINKELEENSDVMVLISNYQSYSEITGGLVSYPRLVEHVKCPVLIIPENTPQANLQNVLYATNYNPEDVRSLKHLSGFMNHLENSHITILHNEKDYDFNEKLKWNGFRHIVQDEVGLSEFDFELKTEKDFIHGMEEFASESNPDLLVLMNEKKGFFQEIFETNKMKNVITRFDKPILVYQEKQEA